MFEPLGSPVFSFQCSVFRSGRTKGRISSRRAERGRGIRGKEGVRESLGALGKLGSDAVSAVSAFSDCSRPVGSQ
jgi:hypothetical protein